MEERLHKLKNSYFLIDRKFGYVIEELLFRSRYIIFFVSSNKIRVKRCFFFFYKKERDFSFINRKIERIFEKIINNCFLILIKYYIIFVRYFITLDLYIEL